MHARTPSIRRCHMADFLGIVRQLGMLPEMGGKPTAD